MTKRAIPPLRQRPAGRPLERYVAHGFAKDPSWSEHEYDGDYHEEGYLGLSPADEVLPVAERHAEEKSRQDRSQHATQASEEDHERHKEGEAAHFSGDGEDGSQQGTGQPGKRTPEGHGDGEQPSGVDALQAPPRRS